MKGNMSLRLLVVEDDPASREFVRSALVPFATVDTARTLAEAGVFCADHDYTLLLVDLALPDGQGDAWLMRQRALGNRSPAVAVTAELDAERRRRLLACGFVEALCKPLAESALRQALMPWIGEHVPIWDDDRALAALGGSKETLLRMRQLFIEELPQQRIRILEAVERGGDTAVHGLLHQMRAGCGFVGAINLLRAVEVLHTNPGNRAATQELLARIDETLSASF